MNLRLAKLIVISIVLILMAGVLSPAAADDRDDRIRTLEERVESLESLLEELRSRPDADTGKLEELERQIQILAEEIEDLKHMEILPKAETSHWGLGPAASKVYGVDRGVSIGGYGEMLYQNFDSTREDGEPSGKTDQLDFLRAVLYFGYKFNDRILFNSEIEYEHATTGRDGEVSVEFAYLDFTGREAINGRAGLLLVPMGFINEYHEPPTFLGARRPLVERYLIPTTWRENGAGVFGNAGSLSYRVYFVAGLAAVGGSSSDAPGFDDNGIRGGRQKGSKSAAESIAVVGRLDWAATPWLTVGGSLYTGDSGQGEIFGARTTIGELHGEVRWRGWQGRAIYVGTTIDDVTQINVAQEFLDDESVGEKQFGWYAEVGYDVLSRSETRHALIPYLRYERFNTQDRVPAGFSANPANDQKASTIGIMWKPLVNVALKADYNIHENAAETGVNQFNINLGFYF